MFSIVSYSALFGATMKIADLLDEHGMKWFKGDKIIFGVLWGLFGSLLVLSRDDIANVVLVMVLAYIVRMRIDHSNHAVAAVMIIGTFVWKANFDPIIAVIFFAIFLPLGLLRDYLGDVRKKKDWIFHLSEPAWYYAAAPAVYAVFTGNWIIFLVLVVTKSFYNLTKYLLYQKGYYREL